MLEDAQESTCRSKQIEDYTIPSNGMIKTTDEVVVVVLCGVVMNVNKRSYIKMPKSQLFQSVLPQLLQLQPLWQSKDIRK